MALPPPRIGCSHGTVRHGVVFKEQVGGRSSSRTGWGSPGNMPGDMPRAFNVQPAGGRGRLADAVLASERARARARERERESIPRHIRIC